NIVGYHLQRAAASGRTGLVTPQAVRPMVERVLRALTKVYAGKTIETEVAIADNIGFRGDEGDLLEMLGNALDNAYEWRRRKVRSSATVTEQKRLALTVEDDGPGIAVTDAERVLQRGIRADESVPGHGIGLAVTRDIVEAYEGTIGIERGALGG